MKPRLLQSIFCFNRIFIYRVDTVGGKLVNIEGIDEFDNKILEVIKNDARMSYSDIGERVGLSRVAVKNRMNAMKEKGIIKAYQTVIDEKMALDDHIEFIIDMEIIPEYFDEVLDDLAKEAYIRKISVLSGHARVQLTGFARNTRSLAKYVDVLYHRMRGIKSVTWHTVLSTLKDVDGGVEYVVRKNKGSEYLEGEQQN